MGLDSTERSAGRAATVGFDGLIEDEGAMSISDVPQQIKSRIQQLDRDEEGVAATEYIIIFALVSFVATIALFSSAVFVKAYRDFMIWWLAHPAV